MTELQNIIKVGFLIFIGFGFNSMSAQGTTWTKDIAPIIYNNCSSCHHPNAIAPFSLMSYEEVKERAYNIRLELIQKNMPPWPADPDFMHFVGEARLEQEEIDAVSEWINEGMPYGNASEEPLAPIFLDNGSLLSTIDYSVEIEPYQIQSDDEEYRWFVIENPFDETVYINQVEVMVGLENLVHHADLFFDLSGTSLQNDMADPMPGFNSNTGFPNNDYYINAWQPGGNIQKYPPGWGVAIPPEADFIIEIHYGPGGIGQIDSTIINLQFVAEKEFERSVNTAWLLYDGAPVLLDGPLTIPANQVSTFHQQTLPIPEDLSLISICPHMHLLGKSYKVWYETAQGDSINLINIPHWDFHWQKYYTFQSIVKIPAGSVIKSEGVYDNTINNHDNPNSPPIDVSRGPFTTDEMFLCYFIFSQYEEGDEHINLDPELITNNTSLSLSFDIKLSPVPVGSSLTVSLDMFDFNNLSYFIYDAQGKLLLRGQIKNNVIEIDVSGINQGVYFLEIINKSQSCLKKFVKQ